MIPRRLLVRPAACRSHLSVYSAPRPVHVLHHRPSRSFHHRYSLLAAEASVPSANASTAASSPSQLGSVRSQPHSSSSSSFDVLGIAFFLGLSGLTLYLGTWQLQRKQWKERLVLERTAALKGEAIDINHLLQEHGNDWHAVPEFQRVSVAGTFDYSGQVKLGPRAAPATKTGLSGQGYYVITPINIDGQTVLVNRGWVDRKHADRIPPETSTAFEAVTHHPEKTPSFLGKYDPEKIGSYISLDAAHIAQRLHLPTQSPLLIDLVSPSPSPLLHRRSIDSYLNFATTPLVHTVYAITWFTLAAAGVAGTYMRFKKGKGGVSEPVRRMALSAKRS